MTVIRTISTYCHYVRRVEPVKNIHQKIFWMTFRDFLDFLTLKIPCRGELSQISSTIKTAQNHERNSPVLVLSAKNKCNSKRNNCYNQIPSPSKDYLRQTNNSHLKNVQNSLPRRSPSSHCRRMCLLSHPSGQRLVTNNCFK